MVSIEEEHKKYRRHILKRWWLAILACLLFVGGAILEGIFGTFGTNLFSLLLNQLSKSIGISWVPWLLTLIFFCFALTCMCIAIFIWWSNRFLHQALNVSTNLLDLDDSLLRLLASWVPEKSHENEMKLLLSELLRDACREFGQHVYRASILLPAPELEREYLKVWSYTKLSQESVDRMKFYIGEDETIRRGVAGQVYRTRELCVAHMKQEGDKWKCDDENYINFIKRTHDPSYRSFVCMPIVGPSPSSSIGIMCLGVLCFDSLNPSIFDSFDTKTILRVFSRRIAAALLVYNLLSPEQIEKKQVSPP